MKNIAMRCWSIRSWSIRSSSIRCCFMLAAICTLNACSGDGHSNSTTGTGSQPTVLEKLELKHVSLPRPPTTDLPTALKPLP